MRSQTTTTPIHMFDGEAIVRDIVLDVYLLATYELSMTKLNASYNDCSSQVSTNSSNSALLASMTTPINPNFTITL